MTLKVPPAAFRTSLSALADLGLVLGREVKTDDVTEQVIDLGARITSAQNGLERTRGSLAKAASLVEVSSLEAEVGRRETELESLLGQQKTLSQRIDLSTIILTIEGAPAPGGATSPSTAPGLAASSVANQPVQLPGFLDGLQGGWKVFTNVGTVVLAVVGASLPFLPFILVGGIVWRLVRRRRIVVPPVPARLRENAAAFELSAQCAPIGNRSRFAVVHVATTTGWSD